MNTSFKYLFFTVLLFFVSFHIYCQESLNTNVKQFNVEVRGDAEGWQSTNIQLQKGESVLFLATGQVYFGLWVRYGDAKGFADPLLMARYNRSGFGFYNHGVLICKNGSKFSPTYDKQKLTGNISKLEKFPEIFTEYIQQDDFIGNYFVSEADQELQFIVNDEKYSDNQGEFKVSVLVVPACPTLTAHFDMAGLVDKSNGVLNFCLKNNCASLLKSDGSYYSSGKNSSGHYYLAINPLGQYGISAAQAVEFLNSHIYEVFPDGAVDITMKSTPEKSVISLNHIYELTNVRFWTGVMYPQFSTLLSMPNPKVKVVEKSTYHFTFKATDEHILKGTAIHGIFKDVCGDLYMFQQGRGLPEENWLEKTGNAIGAEYMWSFMAANMKKLL